MKLNKKKMKNFGMPDTTSKRLNTFKSFLIKVPCASRTRNNILSDNEFGGA